MVCYSTVVYYGDTVPLRKLIEGQEDDSAGNGVCHQV